MELVAAFPIVILKHRLHGTTGCQTGLYNRFDNGFDNRLYRVNGALVCHSCLWYITEFDKTRMTFCSNCAHNPSTVSKTWRDIGRKAISYTLPLFVVPLRVITSQLISPKSLVGHRDGSTVYEKGWSQFGNFETVFECHVYGHPDGETRSLWVLLSQRNKNRVLSAVTSSWRHVHSPKCSRYIWYLLIRLSWLFMAALCNRAGHMYISILWFLSIFFFYSSPNLSGHRLDVYHTSTHGVALVRI